jgi:ATP-dependent metalloprotease
MTKQQLLGNIYTALGGRAAEDLIYGNQNITTGCGSDLQKATQIGYEMARTFAMLNPKFLLSISKKDLGDLKNYEIDLEVKQFVSNAYIHTVDLLRKNKDKLDLLAKKLVEKETLNREEVQIILNLKK